MSKSALNELCQRNKWPPAAYCTVKAGLDHAPRFNATVTVNGATFESELPAKSAKEAHADAARVALLQLSAAAAAAPAPPPPSSGTLHMYKNNLQTYAQRRNLALPVYAHEKDGPPHASRFSCSVTIGGQIYRSEESFPTVKEAENSAAKAALAALQPGGGEEEPVYKSLLQERTQKNGGALPCYETRMIGRNHQPAFVSTVTVEGQVFSGLESKTKKLAEMSAAKVAYTLLTEDNSNRSSDQLVHHQYVPPQPSMPIKQMDSMGNSSGSKRKQEPRFPFPSNSILLEHLHRHIQSERAASSEKGFDIIPFSSYPNELTTNTNIAVMESYVTNPSSGIDSVILKPHALPPPGGPVASPIRVPQLIPISPSQICTPSATHEASDLSVKYHNEGTSEIVITGTEPSLTQPSSKIDSVLVNPPIGQASSSTNGGISSSLQRLIGTSIQQPNRIVVHPRNFSVAYPNDSNVLPISDDDWVAVKSSKLA